LVERALRLVELDASSRNSLAQPKALFERKQDAARALLLHQALRIEALRGQHVVRRFRAEEGPLLRQARESLSAPALAIVVAQEKLLSLLEQQASESAVGQALRELRAVSQPAALADRLRTPFSVVAALERLAPVAGDAEAEVTEVLESYVARGKAPLMLPVWLAGQPNRAEDLERARGQIEVALQKIPSAYPEARASVLSLAAQIASLRGESARALELLASVSELVKSDLEVTRLKSAEARIRLRRGELEAAWEAAQVALELCPEAGDRRVKLELPLVVGQIQVVRGQLNDARACLAPVQRHFSADAGDDDLRCRAQALQAAIWNAEQKWEEALGLSEAALEIGPWESAAHLARFDALSGLERTGEARKAARALADEPQLTPAAKGEIAGWLERSLEQEGN
jgi:hypothetical protein